MLSRRGDLKSSTSAALLLRATSGARLVIQTRFRAVQRVPKIHREPLSDRDRERERERERERIVLTLIHSGALVLSLFLLITSRSRVRGQSRIGATLLRQRGIIALGQSRIITKGIPPSERIMLHSREEIKIRAPARRSIRPRAFDSIRDARLETGVIFYPVCCPADYFF